MLETTEGDPNKLTMMFTQIHEGAKGIDAQIPEKGMALIYRIIIRELLKKIYGSELIFNADPYVDFIIIL